MTHKTPQYSRIPIGRTARMMRLGSAFAGVAGYVAVRAASGIASGERPDLQRLLLSPPNLLRLSNELSRMRGAAMKLGQLVSMDPGDVLPRELAQIFARLRDDAHVMPPRQLKQVLNANWGTDWLGQFRKFNVHPIAAATIGQVHHAVLKDGREMAIKVQYPGVSSSIDSDVRNIGALLHWSGLLPPGFEIGPYLQEARRQLLDETDYVQEAAALQRFADNLRVDDSFVVPQVHHDWSTKQVLAMSFAPGHPVEDASTLPSADRNRIISRLLNLFLREIFEFGDVQSDPNFANYRYDAETGRIILLDFGAVRRIPPGLQQDIRSLALAALHQDREALFAALRRLDVLSSGASAEHDERLFGMTDMTCNALFGVNEFDFSESALLAELQAEGMELANDGHVPPHVPVELLYLQRKAIGLYMLASRLRAKVPLRALLEDYLSDLDVLHRLEQ